MAEAIFQNLIEKNMLSKTLACDSAGTANYHIGDKPDYRTLKVLEQNGLKTTHLGKQFSVYDFEKFDLIVVMDKSNYQDIFKLARNEREKEKIKMMREFESIKTTNFNVPDPYYDQLKDFEALFLLLDDCCNQLLEHVHPNN
jgi:protein-tyrosine phosphatase